MRNAQAGFQPIFLQRELSLARRPCNKRRFSFLTGSKPGFAKNGEERVSHRAKTLPLLSLRIRYVLEFRKTIELADARVHARACFRTCARILRPPCHACIVATSAPTRVKHACETQASRYKKKKRPVLMVRVTSFFLERAKHPRASRRHYMLQASLD